MGILAPLALAALPLLGVIIALYLLKLRRPVAPVGSLTLWQSLTRDREANTLWQRLRVSVLLILQLLALLALVLALARPWVASSQPLGRNAIIVIDISASMASMDANDRGDKTRLQAAKDRALSLVDSLPQDGTATLITSDVHASVVVPPTSDRARLRAAINGLDARPEGTAMVEAMKLASAVAARQTGSAVWVLTDGIFPNAESAVDSMPATLHVVTFGTGDDNTGITALSLQEQAGNLQLFTQVANSRDMTVTKRIDLTVDDQPWTARTVTLGPGATQELIIEDVPLQARIVQAQVAEPDSLPLDDKAWVVNRASAPANVLLVTAGNKFLELALSLLPTVNLYKVKPADYKPSDLLDGSAPDLTIFDAGTPATLLKNPPQGNLLMIAPQASNPLVHVSGVISSPVPSLAATSDTGSADQGSGQNSQDPLLRFVDVSALHIARAAKLQTPSWGRTVLGSDQGPLIVAGDQGNRRVGVVAFDFHDTDLPLQTAFPLLVRNLVTYLLPSSAGGLPDAVAPGMPVGIQSLGPKVDKIIVEDPSAKEWDFAVDAKHPRAAFGATGQPGVYYVSQYVGTDLVYEEAFAVNLFSRDESMIKPNPTPGLPSALTEPEATAAAGQTDEERYRREIWPAVALVGLLVLLGEWGYAQRVVIRRSILEWRSRRAARSHQESTPR